ncbi:uncharacterized protein LOC132701276 [Cylas formicarius]|uniref:uncharacterized protein LOC132701276 n=1 Tax=Cylas formicarius TaxID=197179 RepID=UPI0029583534|nr:uncharacterized protein LOC132701276 [Cylas formicarius]
MAGSELNFFYNSMLAKALVQLVPECDKRPLRQWFDKLADLSDTEKQLETRNEYMWFVLMMLQCQKIREPFRSPPPAIVPPLRDLVPPQVYEEVLVANDGDMGWLDKSVAEETPAGPPKTAPANFFGEQPMPRRGIVCYVAAFSDRRLL